MRVSALDGLLRFARAVVFFCLVGGGRTYSGKTMSDVLCRFKFVMPSPVAPYCREKAAGARLGQVCPGLLA